jgi:lipopolysaccharide/colanic/teichoic acid biosynthesis glycosyltransferase
MILLILYSNKVKVIRKRDKVIKIIIFIIGTPLTLILIIFYFLTLKMNYVNSSYYNNENKNFKIVKFRNIFYARNTLILENLSKYPDTLYGEVSNNGKKIVVYKKENSIKIYIDIFEAKKKLSNKQYKELTTF